MPDQTKNPVMWSSDQIYYRQAKFIAAAADAMPEDKYGFQPTPAQLTFGAAIRHLAGSNGNICGSISGMPAPAATKVAETATKDELVAALKASFEFCDAAMAGATDAKLGDQITWRGGKAPRARAVIELVADLEDHYSQLAGYMRLNDILPPSATPKK
ncbi:DinB family protein [Bryocella elongata]|nr:DinB family protein [Bryocella elongata]